MNNKGMKKIARIFNRLNKVNAELDSAIKFNINEEQRESVKIARVESQLEKAKLKAEAKTAASIAVQGLLQEASAKASVLLNNLKAIMSGEITVSDSEVESIDNAVTEIDD